MSNSAPESPQAATDPLRGKEHLSPSFPFPHDRCGRTVGCPCVVRDIEIRRARAAAELQHRAAVSRARRHHRRAA